MKLEQELSYLSELCNEIKKTVHFTSSDVVCDERRKRERSDKIIKENLSRTHQNF